VFVGFLLLGSAFDLIANTVLGALDQGARELAMLSSATTESPQSPKSKAREEKAERAVESKENAKRKCYWNLLYLAVCVFGGALFFRVVESDHFNFLYAFYMALMTATTVGLGDNSPKTQGGRVFATFWIVASVMVAAKGVADMMSYYVLRNEQRRERRQLKMCITLDDLDIYGGEDGKLDKNEFLLCKLKAMGRVSQVDVDNCYDAFSQWDTGGDGYIDRSEIVQHSLSQIKIQRAENQAKMRKFTEFGSMWQIFCPKGVPDHITQCCSKSEPSQTKSDHEVHSVRINELYDESVKPARSPDTDDLAAMNERSVSNMSEAAPSFQRTNSNCAWVETCLQSRGRRCSKDKVSKPSKEVDALIEKYFHRYDIDSSENLNNNDEMYHLTINLVCTLGIPLAADVVLNMVRGERGGDVENQEAMSLDSYTKWFKDHILDAQDEVRKDAFNDNNVLI